MNRMPFQACRRGALVLSLLAPMAAAAQDTRWYEGRVTFQGDDLPLRIAVADSAGRPAARIDLPTMGMAGQPLELAPDSAGRLSIVMPFELGTFTFDARGDTLAAETIYPMRAGPQAMRIVLTPGAPPPYRTEEVTFGSGAARLAGTVFTPDGPGRHPAVVVVPPCCGAGRQMWEYRSWGDFYARRGYTALVYDKRGVGASTGEWQADSAFIGQADDVVDAARLLRARTDVDPARIGLSGGSQAGWVIPLAAPRVEGLAFVFLSAPPASSPAAVEMQSVEARLRAAGAEPDSIADALAHLGLYFSVVRTGEGWDVLARSVAENRGRSWAQFVPMPDSVPQTAWWRRHAWFDPEPHLRALRVPVLAFFGENDDRVPAALNADRLRQAITAGGNPDVRTRTWADADHRMEVAAFRDDGGAWHWFRLAPGLFETLGEWLALHAPAEARPPPSS